MSCILHIETATSLCSVALSQDGLILDERVAEKGAPHASLLAPFVDELLSLAESRAIPLDAVSVSAGPGSYTGLRIGVSTAKGICYGRGVPLVALPTLEVLCVEPLLYRDDVPDEALLCPMIDARRMEVYAALYDRALNAVRPVAADVVTADTYRAYLDRAPVCFFGDGAEKCRAVIDHPNAIFLPDVQLQARNMLPLAERAVAQRRYADVAYFEPFYLKDFVAGAPRDLLNRG